MWGGVSFARFLRRFASIDLQISVFHSRGFFAGLPPLPGQFSMFHSRGFFAGSPPLPGKFQCLIRGVSRWFYGAANFNVSLAMFLADLSPVPGKLQCLVRDMFFLWFVSIALQMEIEVERSGAGSDVKSGVAPT